MPTAARHWMVVKDNVFLTQRQQPKMALIIPSFQGNELCLNAPEMETLTLKKDFNCSHSKVVKCRIWEVHLDAVDCGDEASQWISKYLSLDGLRIFFSAPFLEKRHIDEEDCDEQENYAIPGDMSTFPDYAPYNLLSQSSIDELNKRLDKPVTVKNFRPNILVEGCTSFAEDSWSEIRIGNKMRFRVLNNCLRCLLTTVDPETGVKNPSMEPLQTLKKFRKLNYKYSPAFGMQLAPDSEGPIKVGDPVYALPRD